MPKIGADAPDYSYQEVGVEWLRGLSKHATDPGRGYLGDEPGLGKSKQLLEAAEGKTLVVAPAMVLDGGVWADEHAKWAPDLDMTCVSYTSLCAREKTGNGNGTRPTEKPRPEFKGPWDTVIFDEAQYLKGRKTTWTLAAQKMRTTNLFLASGTPIPNWAYELFTALQLMFPSEAKPGKRLGSYWRWVGEYFKVVDTEFSQFDISGPLDDSPGGWARFHEENFQGRFLQRLRDDVLKNLPPLTEQTVMLPMSDQQRRVYKGLKKDYIAWTDGGIEVSAFSSGGLHTKLVKVATGLELVEMGAPVSPKFRLFEDRVRDQAQPSLAIGWFQDTARVAAAACVRAKKRPGVITGATSRPERRRVLQDFRDGRIDVLCATIGVIAEGHTFTQADTVHMLERSPVPSKNQQVIRRVHRIGQLRPVTVQHYVTRDCVDERLLPVLKAKTDQQVKALPASEFARLL